MLIILLIFIAIITFYIWTTISKKVKGVIEMEILLLILLLIAGLTILIVFGIMAFQSIQDYLEERKH